MPPPQPSSSAGAERQASRPSTARSAADDYVHKGGTPAWLKFAGQSLTFGAYFVEAVHNDPVERSRVRRCFIRYHLEDGMLEVAEPVEPNSGLQAGRLLHRHRAVLADGTPVTWRHLAVGGELPLYGRAFRITSCDAATRAFYESNGLPVAPDQPAPEGAYDALARFRAYYRSAAAGRPGDGVLFATMGRRDAAAEQYLALSGKVLRFYCCWDNSAEQRDEAGFRVPLILHYHLEDDSLALHFAAGNDDLTEAYPTLLKRGKLPKASPGVGACATEPFERSGDGEGGRAREVGVAEREGEGGIMMMMVMLSLLLAAGDGDGDG